MNTIHSLKWVVSRKWHTNEEKEWWWAKFAAARRRRVWRLSEQQNHRCCYCFRLTWMFEEAVIGGHRPDRLPGMTKHQMATADHIVPVSQGGSERIDNMVMACVRCNQLRGDMPAIEFWECMQDRAKLKAMLRTRGRLKAERDRVKAGKHKVKYDQAALRLGYLFHVFPEVQSVFTVALSMIEDELRQRAANKLEKLQVNDLLEAA